jgi:hypothetical protein
LQWPFPWLHVDNVSRTQFTFLFASDNGGPEDRVSLDHEFEFDGLLANALQRFEKLHAIFKAHAIPRRCNQVRVDMGLGQNEMRITPKFGRGIRQVQIDARRDMYHTHI